MGNDGSFTGTNEKRVKLHDDPSYNFFTFCDQSDNKDFCYKVLKDYEVEFCAFF